MCVLALAVGLGPAPAAAVRYPFRTLSEADGMPMSGVNDAVQDSLGRLWIVGRTGVAVYDGLRWSPDPRPGELPAEPLRRLETDRDGRLWTAARHTPVRVYRRDDHGWRALPPCPHVPWGRDVNAFAVDRGRAAVGVRSAAVHLWRDGAWTRVDLPDGAVVHHLAWQDDRLLAATPAGLFAVTAAPGGGSAVSRVPGAPDGPVYAALPGPGGPLVAGAGWLGRLTPDGVAVTRRDDRFRLSSPFTGVAAVRDSIGGVWIADLLQVYRIHPELGFVPVGRASGLIADGAAGACVDREGQVWLAGPRGVSVLTDPRFAGWDRESGLFADEVSAVLERRDGAVVLGHEGGLTVMGDTLATFRLDGDGPPGRVMGLAEAGDGTVWIAGGGAGLGRLTAAGPDAWRLRPARPGGSVAAVAVDDRGRLWAGGTAGLYRAEGAGLAPVPLATAADTATPAVRRIHAAPDGGVWVATARRGVILVEDGGTRRFTADDPSANSTYAVAAAPGGGWWVGTAAGLRRLTETGIGAIGPDGPHVDRPVYAIAGDDRGRIWLGTDAGVRVWDGTDLRTYDARDGLIGSETNRAALTVDGRGRVWIGTDRGVTVFDARFAWPDAPAPAARVQMFVVDGTPVPPDRPLRLGPDVRELVVRLDTDSLAPPDRLRFRTFLEGYDARWQEARVLPDRTLRFTTLPAGRYRFHVQAVDAAGRSGPVYASAPLRVAPPVWRRAPVLLAGATALVGLAWLVFAAVTGRRYARRLRAEVRDRTAALEASERAVREESQRLAVVLRSISEGVVVADADGRIGLANAAAGRLLDVAAERLPGRSLEEVLPGVTAPMREARAAALTGASAFVADGARFPYRLGTSGRRLEIAVAALDGDGGEAGGRVLVLHDVTSRRRSEDARERAQRLDALGVLAGGVAHDFNNLLTMIRGNTGEAAAAAGLPPAAVRHLAEVGTAAERARRLTGRLLDFARGAPPAPGRADLAALARAAAAAVLADGPVRAAFDLPADLRPAAVDPEQAARVLRTLLAEARRISPRDGAVTVRGRNVAGDDGLPCVEVAVADEGPGIPPADLDRVFDPYYTARGGRAGLDLAEAHAVAVRHGGSLAAATRPGGGAVCTLRLPAARRADGLSGGAGRAGG